MTKVVALLSFLASSLPLGGCGDPEQFTDAGADPDGAPAPDASTTAGNVIVHVDRLDGSGASDLDATVYFNAPGGGLLDTGTPDGDGLVVGTMEPGGSVTVRFGGTSLDTLRTVMGVAVGDELYFGAPVVSVVGTMTVSLPAATGAIRYGVVGPCATSIQGASTTVSVTLTAGCSATRPLLAVADRGASADQYIAIPDATPTGGATINVGGPWVDPVAGPDISVTGIPADVTSRSAAAAYYADGHHVSGVTAPLTAGDPATATFGLLPGIGQAMTTYISTSTSTSGYQVRVHATPIPGTLAIDATPILPVIEVDERAGGVGWTTTAAGVADAFVLSTEELGPKSETLAQWELVVSPDADGFAYPEVANAPDVHLADVQLIEIDVVDGYAAFRARAGLEGWRFGPPEPVPAAYVTHVSYVN